MGMSKQRIDYLEVQAKKPAKQWIFIFHGYGADAYDLRSLSDALQPNHASETQWIFPNGPLSVPIGPGWSGRAWWPIDMARFEKLATNPDGPYDWTELEPENLPLLRTQLLSDIQRIAGGFENVILGGFSQGAMLACDLFLHAPTQPKGLFLLSGSLINKGKWAELATKHKGFRYFQSHGRKDPVLPHRSAAQLETVLTQGGMKGSLYSFDGTHEIPLNVIQKANEYLKNLP